MNLTPHVVGAVLAIAQPGPKVPPGMGGVTTLLSWASWGVSIACLLGVFVVAGTMALRHQQGRGGEPLGALGWVMAACVLGASAGPLVTALGV